MDAGEAAIIAGYSPKNANGSGNRLLRYPRIQTRLAELRAELETQNGYSRPKMMRELEEVIAKASEGDYPNFNAILKAKEMQCKMLGYFEPEQQQVNNFNMIITRATNAKPQEAEAHVEENELFPN